MLEIIVYIHNGVSVWDQESSALFLINHKTHINLYTVSQVTPYTYVHGNVMYIGTYV